MEEDSLLKKNIGEKINSKITGGIEGIVSGFFNIFLFIAKDIPRVGLQSILAAIFSILSYILRFMKLLFTKIIPFLLKYIGIPLFILGAILALIFFGGHIFFIVSLMVGVFLYVKGIYNLTINIPVQSKDIKPNTSNTSNSYKIGK